jgi:hypothetical protein
MSDQTFIRELEAYCAETGYKPGTVCVRALGDSRFYDRLVKRQDRISDKIAQLRTFMTANPPRAKDQNGEAA